jgi:hypothetical protein
MLETMGKWLEELWQILKDIWKAYWDLDWYWRRPVFAGILALVVITILNPVLLILPLTAAFFAFVIHLMNRRT